MRQWTLLKFDLLNEKKRNLRIFFSIWNMNWSSSHHLQWWMKTYLCHFAFSTGFPSSILRSKNFPRLNWTRLPQLEAKPVCGLQLIGLCKIELLGNICILLLRLLRFDRTHLHDIYVSCWFLWANFTWMSLHFVCVCVQFAQRTFVACCHFSFAQVYFTHWHSFCSIDGHPFKSMEFVMISTVFAK